MAWTFALSSAALLASDVSGSAHASTQVGSQSPFYYACADNATISAEKFTELSAHLVVPPAPSAKDDRVTLDFDLGVQSPGSYSSNLLEVSLHYSKGYGWMLQSCGYNTKDADEGGRSCGASVLVPSGHDVKLSVELSDGQWILSGKDNTAGKESLRHITEYNAGPGEYTTAYVKMRRVNNTYHAQEFRCDHLPACDGLQFDKISVNGNSGADWKASSECGGSCASKLTFKGDGTSIHWSWDAHGTLLV